MEYIQNTLISVHWHVRTLRTLLKTLFRRTYGHNRDEVQFGSELRRSVCSSFPSTSESRKAECRNIKENSDAEYSFPNYTIIVPTKCTGFLLLKAQNITICAFCLCILSPYMFQPAWAIFRGRNVSV
jgi:hypothetical protein